MSGRAVIHNGEGYIDITDEQSAPRFADKPDAEKWLTDPAAHPELEVSKHTKDGGRINHLWVMAPYMARTLVKPIIERRAVS